MLNSLTESKLLPSSFSPQQCLFTKVCTEQENISLTIIVSVHLSKDLVCPLLWRRFILGHLHH